MKLPENMKALASAVHIPAYISRTVHAINAMNLRERVILAITCILLLTVLLQVGWADRIYKKRLKIEAQITQIQAENNAAQNQLLELHRVQAVDPNEVVRTQMASVRASIDTATEKLKTALRHLIKPREVIGMLRGLLAAQSGLRLIRMETLEPERIDLSRQSAKNTQPDAKTPHAVAQESKEKVAAMQPNKDALYRHWLKLELLGNYQSISEWLLTVEQLPMRVQWDTMDYTVEEDPNTHSMRARLVLRLYTISMQKEWLRV